MTLRSAKTWRGNAIAAALFVAAAAVAFLSWAVPVVVWPENRQIAAEDLLVPAEIIDEFVPEALTREENFDLPTDADTQVRRWQVGDRSVSVRLEITKARNPFWGRVAWLQDSPESGYRDDFPHTSSSVIQLVDADDAASICVHGRGADCRIYSYWLRFGQYLVQMAITNQGSGASHADFRKDEMLVAVARHVRGKLES